MTQENNKHFSARPIWGIIVIIIGLAFLLHQLGVGITIGDYWPIFLIAPGLGFWLLFIAKRKQSGIEGVLIPGTILLLYGLLFFYEIYTDWETSGDLSFLYVFSLGLAFFAAHYFGGKKRGLLIPAWILTAVSIIILFSTVIRWDFIWPIAIIILGLWLLFRPRKNKDKTDSKQAESGTLDKS